MDENAQNNSTESNTKLMLVAAPAKKRGVNPGAKRGPYNKNQTVEDAVIEEDIHYKKLDEFTSESEYEEVIQEQAPPPPPPEPEERKEEEPKVFKPKYNTHLFNGLFLLKIFNFIFPALLKSVLVLFGVSKAKKLKVANLKLEPDEQEDFEDIADEAAPYIFGKIHPMILGITLFGYTYVRKAMIELDAIPDEEEKN
ncbi:MAG TPA: hypothetical protein VK835_02655 [Bacteroidia bacterium]|jgi:hypothetical protein|nr:hypothetical protein [Bacteroidia bacterium]